jgi:hypothetical protein
VSSLDWRDWRDLPLAASDRRPAADALPLLPRRARETVPVARPAARPDLGLLQKVLNGLKSLD